MLSNGGKQVVAHDFRFPVDQRLLDRMRKAVGVPSDMDSFMFTFISYNGKQLVLLGHPTFKLMEEAITLRNSPGRLLIDQGEMHDAPKTYDLWTFQGEMRRYPITMPVAEALRQPGAPVPRPTFPSSQGQ